VDIFPFDLESKCPITNLVLNLLYYRAADGAQLQNVHNGKSKKNEAAICPNTPDFITSPIKGRRGLN
jgi:hypothetical protein